MASIASSQGIRGILRKTKFLAIYRSFLIVLLPMTVSLLVMLFVDAIPLFDISFVLSALVMYSFILSDQIEQNLRHQPTKSVRELKDGAARKLL